MTDPQILKWTSQSSAASKGGSIRWQAPELFGADNDEVVPNSKESDIYAWSCVCYEVFRGVCLLCGRSDSALDFHRTGPIF